MQELGDEATHAPSNSGLRLPTTLTAVLSGLTVMLINTLFPGLVAGRSSSNDDDQSGKS